MDIKINETWRTRGGDKVKIVSINNDITLDHPISFKNAKGLILSATKNGRFLCDHHEDNYDLMEKIIDE